MKKSAGKSKGAYKEESREVKKVYRSREDKIIAGVCGGIAEYLDVDSVWIRLVAVLLVFLSGIGLVMYIVAWIIMPKNPNQKMAEDTKAEKVVEKIAVKISKKNEDSNDVRVGEEDCSQE
jgi:phage shock protein C